MNRRPLVRLALALALVLATTGVSQAVFSVWSDPDFAFRGATWVNGPTASLVKVRVQSVGGASTGRVRILLTAAATDGTAVNGSALAQIPSGHIREYPIFLAKPVSSLMFIRIIEL
jgi:hypothetical protein